MKQILYFPFIFSTATYIYDGNIKEVYQRPDGALKIKYYDNSDVEVITNIED